LSEDSKNINWKIVGVVLLIAIAGIFIWNARSGDENTPERMAYNFLKDYYTVDDSELADFFYEEVVGNPKPNMDALEEFGNMVKEKYGPLMTVEGLEEAMANRFIPGGGVSVRGTGNKMFADSVTLIDYQEYKDGRIYYKYQVPVEIVLANGEVENTMVVGEIVMKEVEGEWKVDVLRPNFRDLSRLISYGVSNLKITNWDVEEEVWRVEVNWDSTLNGGTNADSTAMELGASFDFIMPNQEGLSYAVKVFDKEDSILVQEEFTSNFSPGRNMELYIMWDKNRESVVLSESYDAIIGGSEGPTPIVVQGGEFQRSIKTSLKKVVNGKVDRTVEIADNCSMDIITEVVMDHMIRSAAWEGIDVRELDEYYILMDHLFEEGETKENYIYIDQGEIFYQGGLDGMRTNITEDSYESIRSFFNY